MGYADGAARYHHGERHLTGVVVHQHHVGSLDGGITSQGSHGDTYVGTLQDWRIVDAVAHVCQRLALRFLPKQALHMSQFVGRQQFGMTLVDTHFCGYLPARLLMVARQHHGLLHSQLSEQRDSLSTPLLDTIVHHHGSALVGLYENLAVGKRARLVKHDRPHTGKSIHVVAALDEDTVARSTAYATKEGKRHTDDQGTRTGNHQEYQRPVEPQGEVAHKDRGTIANANAAKTTTGV